MTASARFFTDDSPIGQGRSLVRDVPLDQPLSVRIEADGFDDHITVVTVTAGERLRMLITLTATDPQPSTAPE